MPGWSLSLGSLPRLLQFLVSGRRVCDLPKGSYGELRGDLEVVCRWRFVELLQQASPHLEGNAESAASPFPFSEP